MISQNCYDYIVIGLAIRLLRNVKSTDTADFALKPLRDLKELFQSCGFEVSLAATTSETHTKLIEHLEELEPASSMGEAVAREAELEATRIENVVFPEALTKKIYVLPKRRFNSEYLLNKPEQLFREGGFDKLGEVARHDVISACRCVLFGEATAAAFHILRATEDVLRDYYRLHRKKNRLKNLMWGPMVEQLQKKKTKPPPSVLLQELEMIRSAFRNPTNHPEAIYDIESAQDLFGVCLDALTRMVSEL